MVPEGGWTNLTFAAFLLLVAAALVLRGASVLRRSRQLALDERERNFLRRQFRRRLVVNLLIAATGLAVLAGAWITRPAWLVLIYWLAVMGLVGLILLGMVVDVIGSRAFLSELYQRQAVERDALEAELRKLQQRDGNGKPSDEDLSDRRLSG